MAAKETTRITVDLTPEMYARLEKLVEATDAMSKAEVIRKALRLFDTITTRTAEGYELRMRKGTDEQGVLIIYTSGA